MRAAGIRTGLFTSPHLIEPTERIQIDGIPVSPADFERAFNVVHEAAEKLDLDCHPTYFETVTAMAFWLFREKSASTPPLSKWAWADAWIRPTWSQPALTVITPIDFDHEAYLGHTIEAIASEKAGILKPGVPAVFARAASGSRSRAGSARRGTASAGDTRRRLRDSRPATSTRAARDSRESSCPLAGEHQVDNAVTAALALRALGVSPTESQTPAGPDASSTFLRIPTSSSTARTIQPARARWRVISSAFTAAAGSG